MKIGTKIILGFSSILALTAIVGAIGWAGLDGYATGVDKARVMSDLAVDLRQLPLHIAEFERSHDEEELSRATRVMDEALHRADRLAKADTTSSMAVATQELQAYQAALERYGDLQIENRQRQAAMFRQAEEIDEKAKQIYDRNHDRYLTGLFILEDLEQQSAQRFAFLEAANALKRATLAARLAEAEFQLAPDPETQDRAASFMKEIYLSNLALKKLAKEAGEEGEAIKALSGEVKEYRRRFAAFIDAFGEGTDVKGAKLSLDDTSQKVQTLVDGIATRQKNAFASIAGQAQSARAKVRDAFAATTQSMTLLNRLLKQHEDEEEFFQRRDPAIRDHVDAMIEETMTALTALSANAKDDTEIIQQALDILPTYRDVFAEASAATFGQADALAAMRDREAEVLRLVDENLAKAVADMADLYDWGHLTLAIVGVVALLVGFSISILTGRSITRPLEALTSSIADLARGNAAVTVPETDRRDEIGDMARSMGVIRETGAKALRAQRTLENTDSCLMMIDDAGRVAHVNPAFCALAERVRDSVGPELAGFAAQRFNGQAFDAFHNEPALTCENVARLDAPEEMLVAAGGHTFSLKLNPIFDEQGASIGTVISWRDRTLQIRLEAEVEALIDAATAGNLEGRLATDRVDGFMLTLCQGMNRLMDTAEGGVKAAHGVMSALASGDLTCAMTGTYGGIFEELQDSSNRMRAELASIATNIIGASGALSSAAQEIGSGTSDLTARTQAQSASVDETSTAMADVTAMVRRNTDSAMEANRIAANTCTAADSGYQVVGQAVEAMERIQAAAAKVTDIVSMIDEIAFQTNLLALNASVEAARAGEAGKGFAVVASEVRALAQRSAAASGEIKELIEGTVGEIDSGVSLVQQVGNGLEGIVNSVNSLAEVVSEITQASQEQSTRLAHVGKAVSEMGGMAEQNASLAEQTMAAVQSQGEQVIELDRLVRFFKIKEDAIHLS